MWETGERLLRPVPHELGTCVDRKIKPILVNLGLRYAFIFSQVSS